MENKLTITRGKEGRGGVNWELDMDTTVCKLDN